MPVPDRPVEDSAAPSPAPRGLDHRALAALVRRVAAGSYGVARVGVGGWRGRLARLLGRDSAGVTVSEPPPLRVEVELELLPGVPAAQVAQNVEDSVRYLVQRDLGVTIDDLLIRVAGTQAEPR